jgi:hypothetical protein
VSRNPVGFHGLINQSASLHRSQEAHFCSFHPTFYVPLSVSCSQIFERWIWHCCEMTTLFDSQFNSQKCDVMKDDPDLGSPRENSYTMSASFCVRTFLLTGEIVTERELEDRWKSDGYRRSLVSYCRVEFSCAVSCRQQLPLGSKCYL